VAAAADGGRLQHRGQVDRAYGGRRLRRPGQPRRAAGHLPRPRRQPALIVRCAAMALAAVQLAACQPAEPDRGEDRAAIHALLVEYGRTLDARDFDGFGALFASGGVYVAGGPDAEALPGPEAGEAMRRTFAANALGF